VPALPSSVLEPLWVQVAALLPSARIPIPSAATASASPTASCSTSSSRSWCSAAATGASRTPPARRPPCAAAATSGSPSAWPSRYACWCWPPMTGCSAWRWSTWRGRVHHQGALWRPDRRAKRARPAQTGPQTVGRRRGGRHPAGRAARPGQSPRRWAAGGHPGRRRRGRGAARPASRAPGCRLRLPALPAGPGRTRDGWPGRHAGRPGTDPGGPPVGDRAHARLGQPVWQAALVHRAPPAGRGILAGGCRRRHRLWPAAT
jgi:hypothetical protein